MRRRHRRQLAVEQQLGGVDEGAQHVPGVDLVVVERRLDREPVDDRRQGERDVGGRQVGELARLPAVADHALDQRPELVLDPLTQVGKRRITTGERPQLDPRLDVVVRRQLLEDHPQPARVRVPDDLEARAGPRLPIGLLAQQPALEIDSGIPPSGWFTGFQKAPRLRIRQLSMLTITCLTSV
jgi:hypothetical protein